MSKFALEKIDAVNGRQDFQKLVINDKCLFDEFENEIRERDRYTNELAMVYQYMQYVADCRTLPKTKFRDITPDNEKVKEYEFKTKHLRIYAIKKANGKIIIMGGFKNNQSKDIRKFQSIKKQYLESLNEMP